MKSIMRIMYLNIFNLKIIQMNQIIKKQAEGIVRMIVQNLDNQERHQNNNI